MHAPQWSSTLNLGFSVTYLWDLGVGHHFPVNFWGKRNKTHPTYPLNSQYAPSGIVSALCGCRWSLKESALVPSWHNGLLLASSSLWEWSWADSGNSSGAGDRGMSGSFPLLPLKLSSLRGKCCLSAFSGPSKLICRAMQRRTAINPLLSLQAFH